MQTFKHILLLSIITSCLMVLFLLGLCFINEFSFLYSGGKLVDTKIVKDLQQLSFNQVLQATGMLLLGSFLLNGFVYFWGNSDGYSDDDFDDLYESRRSRIRRRGY